MRISHFYQTSKLNPRHISEDNITIMDELKAKSISPDKKEIFTCKICFRTESDHNDPLLTPCNCNGSMGYIHYQCLKQCIKIRLIKKESENYICYIWKNYECEICLKEFPKYIRYKNTIYNLIDYSIPYLEYLIMDYTLYDDLKKKILRKGIIVINIKEEELITVGRSQNNKIKLKDISVSRNHCVFFKKENKIFIKDKGSKFGTLVYLNEPYTINLEENNTTNKNTEKKNTFNNKSFLENNRNNSSIFQPTCISKNINVDNTIFVNNSNQNQAFIQKVFSGLQVNLVSGKNFLNFKIFKNWNLFGSIFSKTFCCKYKSTNDDEFIIDLDNEKANMKDKEMNCYNIKENRLIYTENISNIHNLNLNNNNINQENNYVNDSYMDYYLNIDTIIRQTENNINEEIQVNDDNSFL